MSMSPSSVSFHLWLFVFHLLLLQLALKLHPDKNSAHKAEDAFKSVSRAFSCLSDADKRAYYDRTGKAREPKCEGKDGEP